MGESLQHDGRRRHRPASQPMPARRVRSHLRAVDWLLGLSFLVIFVLGALLVEQRHDLEEVRRDAQASIDATRADVDAVANEVDQDSAFDANRVAERVAPYVFTLDDGTRGGTAFAMFRDGAATVLVTSDHVVRDDAGELARAVTLVRDAREYQGRVIASSRPDDVALVRLPDAEGAGLDRDQLLRSAWEKDADPGEGSPVLAYGSPLGLHDSKSQGIVSALREDGLIQFDAPVNPGNSGGPLLDRDGDVVGVVTAELVGPTSTRATGLSFALDIAGACRLAERVLDDVEDCASDAA